MAETIVDAARPRRGIDLRELWRYRDLLIVLAHRDIAVRYRQTVLGVLWAILLPVSTMVVFTVVFGRLAKLPSDGIPYSLFALAGLLPWIFFSTALNAIAMSVVASGNLISKVYFPRLIVPAAALGAPLVDLLVASAFFLVLLAAQGYWPSASALVIPLLFVTTALTALGVGTLIAALMVSYRDFRHLIQPMLLLWLFLTPVVYPLKLVPEAWRWLLWLNPLAGTIEGIRAAWFGLPFDVPAIVASFAVSLALLWIGVAFFRSVERRFADII